MKISEAKAELRSFYHKTRAVEAIKKASEKLDSKAVQKAVGKKKMAFETIAFKLMHMSGLHAELLAYRYVDFLQWADVAEKLNYSEQHVKGKLHSEALIEYAKMDLKKPPGD